MPPPSYEQIHEQTTIFPEASLASGRPEDGKVVFEYWKNNATRLATNTVNIPADESPAGVEDRYTAPLVADDEASYTLTAKVLVNGKELSQTHYEVWPQTGTLVAVDEVDTTLATFPYKVKQGAALSGVRHARAANKENVYQLEKGEVFTIEAQPPFAIIEEIGAKGRKRKVRVTQNFQVEILAPAQLPKQFVNLPSTTNGQDGKGNRVRIVLGVRGDNTRPQPAQSGNDQVTMHLGGKGGDTKPQPVQSGNDQIACYIEVRFLPADGVPALSKRDQPLREVIDGSDLLSANQLAPGKHYKARVAFGSELDGREVGIFEIELGYAGGDTCELKVGSTPACADATLTFVNWRRVYYELLTMDFMALTDFPPATRSHLKTAGDKIFVEYTLDRMVTVPKETAEEYSVFRREFMGQEGGPADVYVAQASSRAGFDMSAFGKAEQPREVCFALADYVAIEDDGGTKTVRPAVPFTTVEVTVNLGDKMVWLPDRNDPDGNLEIRWTADVTKHQAKRLATLNIVEVEDASQDTKEERVITIAGLLDDLTVKYAKPKIGNIPSDMSRDGKGRVAEYMETRWGDYRNLVVSRNQVDLTIRGSKTTANAVKRFNAARAVVEQAFATVAPGLSEHPGIHPRKGEPRTGELNADVVDFTKSTKNKIVLNLPVAVATDPGNLVGPLSNTKCPLKLELEFTPYRTVAGYSRPGTLEGAVAIHGKPELVLAETILHEIGHKMAMTLTAGNSAKTAPGLATPKTVSQEGTAYPRNGTKGHAYIEHGHQGEHCAYGLSDVEKAAVSYDTAVAEPKAPCVMFGVSDQRDGSTRQFFCEECAEHLRARDLRDLTT